MSDYSNNPLCFVADSAVHGRGLFARHHIPAGTWIGHYDGPQTQENGIHVLWLEADEANEPKDENAEEVWVGFDGNNELRFMNHAKDPNGDMDELDLYANRDISAGEEITIHYGEEFDADI